MADKKSITIDLNRWATSRELARELGWDTNKNSTLRTQRVSNFVKRHDVKTWHIKELNLRLIDRNQVLKILKELHNYTT